MIHLDYETTSACDIGLGSYRYACDPSTRILMFAVAREGEEPVLWDFLDGGDEALAILREAEGPIWAHNAQFEHAVSRYRLQQDTGLPAPDIDRWRCTAAMCRRAAAPASLAEAAKFFKLGDLKDPVGKALIGIFSDQSKLVLLRSPDGKHKRKSHSPILEPDGIPWDWTMTVAGDQMTVRDAWERFKDYCLQDVRVEMELHEKLKHFELKGRVLESFQFDFRMNDRGVPVNLDALRNADKLVNDLTERLTQRIIAKCGVAPTRRDAMLAWLRERGYPEDNLRAGTVDAILGDPPAGMTAEAVEVLRLRSLVGFAALKKIPTMIASACPDGYVRGTTQWHAARTGRAGGRIIQPQNFRKTTIGEDTHLCYRMIREGWEPEWFEELWESPLEAIASSIRHFIQPHEGSFYDGDFAAVEARITPWLAGDEKKLKSILDGIDPYKRLAALMFGTTYDQVDKVQRTTAKPVELGCCFGVGTKSLKKALAEPPYNVERTWDECKSYVKTYRENHPETVDAWRGIEDAVKTAIFNPGERRTACGGKLKFRCGQVAGVPYLVMTLPSGRGLYYPYPKVQRSFKPYDDEELEAEPWKAERAEQGFVIEDGVKKQKLGYYTDQISFYGKLSGKSAWGRIGTWGSRLFENAVQSIGADLLNRGCTEAEGRGFPICMIIHDQALCEARKSNGGLAEFLAAMCAKDDWASDFPLDADGDEHPYYLKQD